MSLIQGVYKDKNGKGLIVIEGVNYCPHPECADKMPFIETDLTYENAVTLLDGKVIDIGNIKMTTQDYLSNA